MEVYIAKGLIKSVKIRQYHDAKKDTDSEFGSIEILDDLGGDLSIGIDPAEDWSKIPLMELCEMGFVVRPSVSNFRLRLDLVGLLDLKPVKNGKKTEEVKPEEVKPEKVK